MILIQTANIFYKSYKINNNLKVNQRLTELKNIVLYVVQEIILLNTYNKIWSTIWRPVPSGNLMGKYKKGIKEHQDYPLQGWKFEIVYVFVQYHGNNQY